MNRSSPRLSFVAAGLLALCLIIYWPVKEHPFLHFDEHVYITENTTVRDGLTLRGLLWAFSGAHESNWHPLTWLSHMLDVQLFGLDPRAHHLMNLILHAANTVLLFGILTWMTGALWRGALVAALFAAHPLHVESVAWLAERKDVLSTFFWMAATTAYLRYARRPRPASYLTVLMLFALGLMAKPMLVTLPIVFLLLDFWPLGRMRGSQPPELSGGGFSPTKLFIEKIPLLALSAASSAITYYSQATGGSMSGLELIPLKLRAANALSSYIRYPAKMLWPVDLSVLYPFPLTGPPTWEWILALLFIVTVSVAVAFLARRRPYLLVGWFWYLGTLVPVIGIVQVGAQAMADRYTYVPLIGLFAAICWGMADVSSGLRLPQYLPRAAAAVVVVLLSAVSRHQVAYWQDDITLFSHGIDVTRGNWLLLNNLGAAFFEQSRYQEAEKSLRESLMINGKSAKAHHNLAVVLNMKKEYAESVKHYLQAIQLNPSHADTYYNLGNIYAQQYNRYEEAVRCFSKVLEIDPRHKFVRNNLALAFVELGRFREALYQMETSVRQDPSNPNYRYNLGIILDRFGRTDDALIQYREAIRLDSKHKLTLEQLDKGRFAFPGLSGRGGVTPGPPPGRR